MRPRPSIDEIIRNVHKYGSISEYARVIDVPRRTVSEWHKQAQERINIASPDEEGKFPARTYIVTTAQIKTDIHTGFWQNLQALAKDREAEILIPTITYNKHCDGTHKGTGSAESKYDADMFDVRIRKYMFNHRIKLNNKIELLGNLNILPTAVNPLSGYQTFTGSSSAILPHPKIAFDSIATAAGKLTKFLTTCGSVTVPNYMQKNAGIKGEFHHQIGALIVEVVNNKQFHMRHILAEDDGSFYDLTERYENGKMTTGHRVDSIVWGDIHSEDLDPDVWEASWNGPECLTAILKPRYQFFHDLLDFKYRNHHNRDDDLFMKHMNNKLVIGELQECVDFLKDSYRTYSKSVVVASNHDNAYTRWIKETTHHEEPNLKNAILLLESQLHLYKNASEEQEPNMFEWICKRICPELDVTFLNVDDSFKVNGIENGMHGDKGVNGARGSAKSFTKIGPKCNIGHSHCLTDNHSVHINGKGWVKISEIVEGDLVNSWDPKENCNKFVPIKEALKFNYTGTIIKIGNGRLRQEVTTNHHLTMTNGEYLPVGEAIATRHITEVPTCSMYSEEPKRPINIKDDDIRRIVAVCADGSIDRNYNTRFHLKKQRKVERLKMLFKEDIVNIDPKVTSKGAYKFNISKYSEACKLIQKWLLTGKEKCLPGGFLQLNNRQAELFLEELKFWDGSYLEGNSRQFSTSKDSEADLVSLLCNRLGYRTTCKLKSKRDNIWHLSWDLSRIQKVSKEECDSTRLKSWKVLTEKVTNKEVYCLQNELHNFWVKHDPTGKVSLTGNSARIIEGVYQAGCSRTLRASYAKGPSSWSHTHVIQYPNGRRTLLTLINGKYFDHELEPAKPIARSLTEAVEKRYGKR